jgi:hypothetical protein
MQGMDSTIIAAIIVAIATILAAFISISKRKPKSGTSSIPSVSMENRVTVVQMSIGVGDHFYTMSTDERDRAIANGYKSEGIACYVFDSLASETMPLYRLYNQNSGDHFYTMSADERDRAIANGYKSEGIACYVFDSLASGTVPLYRLYKL